MAHKGREIPYAGCRDFAFPDLFFWNRPPPSHMTMLAGQYARTDLGLLVIFPEGLVSQLCTYEYSVGTFTYQWLWDDAAGVIDLKLRTTILGQEHVWWETDFEIQIDGMIVGLRTLSGDIWGDSNQMSWFESWELPDDQFEEFVVNTDGTRYEDIPI